MKTIKINLNELQDVYACGNCFEHNSSEIQIVLTQDIYANCEYFTLDFKNSIGDTFLSERISKNLVAINDDEKTISYKLPSKITQYEDVNCVVTGYKEENETIILVSKSSVINLHFNQSINGEENIDKSVFGLEAELSKYIGEMKKKTKTVYCEDLLASGTFTSTSSNIDTGITVNQLRQYEYIFFNIAGGSIRNTISLNLGYSDENYSSSDYGIINIESMMNVNVLLSWIDLEKKHFVGYFENNAVISGDDYTSYPGNTYSIGFYHSNSTTCFNSFGNCQIGSIDLNGQNTEIDAQLSLDSTLVWNLICCSNDFTWKMYGVMKKEVQDD